MTVYGRIDEWLPIRIKAAHVAFHEIYGATRILHDLTDKAIYVGKQRIARLMCKAGIRDVSRRRRWNTAKREAQVSPVDYLAEQKSTAQSPDELWVSDVTSVPAHQGFLFLSVCWMLWR